MMKTFTKLLMGCACCFLANSSFAKIIYVNAANGSATVKDGTTWSTAFVSLQDALNDAISGDQIWVTKGVYKPSTAPAGLSITSGTMDYTFFIPEGVALYGGFIGNETGLDGAVIARDFINNETILDGDLNGDDDQTDLDTKADNVFHVVTIVGHATNLFVLDGLTVQNGYATGSKLTQVNGSNYYSFYGGGIFLREAAGTFRNLIIKNNIVNANTATSVAYAGGMFTAGAKNISIINTSFKGNKSLNIGAAVSHAGALYLALPSPILENVTFEANEVKNFGGAVSFGSGNSVIKNAKFLNNVTANNGGAVYITVATTQATFINTVFYNNEAKVLSAGGAIYLANGKVDLINNTLFGNKATTASSANGGAVFVGNQTTAILNAKNCIFLGNEAIGAGKDIAKGINGVVSVSNSLTQGTAGTNVVTNADAANVFLSTDPSNLDFLKLRPSTGNPAINMGDDNAVPVEVTVDLAGQSRKIGTVDMGAYENTITPLPVKLIGFTAKVQQAAVLVKWLTETETNNDYFLLERSSDGVNYNPLTKVASKGSAGYSYQFTDDRPLSGTNYYRLSQTDKDGTKVTFYPEVVNFSLQGEPQVEIYPNPVRGDKVTIGLAGQKFTKLQFVNLQGQSLQSLPIKGNDQEKTIDVSSYPKGTYLIRLFGDNNAVTMKVIKI
ncbi:hypothetical protein D3C87_361590 [compost metagenome]